MKQPFPSRLTIYDLKFHPKALKEWRKLGGAVRKQLKKKIEERLINPHVPAAVLRELKHHYKIKFIPNNY